MLTAYIGILKTQKRRRLFLHKISWHCQEILGKNIRLRFWVFKNTYIWQQCLAELRLDVSLPSQINTQMYGKLEKLTSSS